MHIRNDPRVAELKARAGVQAKHPAPQKPQQTPSTAVIHLPAGDTYEGSLVDDLPHGQGSHIWPTRQVEVKQGVYTWPTRQGYVGGFKRGRYGGTGVYTWPNGERHVGGFKHGRAEGRGTHTWPDGRIYRGEFKSGQFEGYGDYTLRDGRRYEGPFKDGQCHGVGHYTLPNGIRRKGEFRHGKLILAAIYLDFPPCIMRPLTPESRSQMLLQFSPDVQFVPRNLPQP